MTKIVKISRKTSSRLDNLITALDGTCSFEEKQNAIRIFKLYFNGNADIDESFNKK